VGGGGGKQVTYVEDDKREEDLDVFPPVRILDVGREVQEHVRGSERAEFASRSGVRVGEVTSGASNVWIHVPRAGHTTRRIDGRVLDVRTGYLLSADS
jgi:hypothetical protein